MHYIDVGMDVHGTDKPVIGGQVIQSSPGGICMRCMGFLTDEKLALEAVRYGKAGARPQVVWPNGVLASTAVGLAVDLVTNWTRKQRSYAYLVYDGNEGTVSESFTLKKLKIPACPHFSAADIGDPVLVELVNKRGDNSGGVSVSFCEPVFAATGAWHVAMAGAVVGPSRPECAPAFELPPSSGATVPQETQVQWAEASGMAARCTPALESLSDEFPSKLTESECPEWNDVPERNIITRQQHANRELLHALRLMAEVAALNSRADWRLMVS